MSVASADTPPMRDPMHDTPMRDPLLRVIAPMRRIPNRTDIYPVDMERRFATRKPSDTPGFIGSNKFSQPVRCIVRNTSSSGALVEIVPGKDRMITRADELPNKFTLVFLGYRERTEVNCQVMRMAGAQAGVRYVSPFRTFPVSGTTGNRPVVVKSRKK